MCKDKMILVVFFVISCTLAGCAVTSSGNMVGEAAAVKYSTDEKKYRIAEVGVMYASSNEDCMFAPHYDVHYKGGTLNLKASLYSLDYSFLGQKGGLFLSVPLTIPLDVGLRPSFVQWIGPLYLGAGVSFVSGFYPNEQDDDYEPEADDSYGRFDGFILYNFGGGIMFDVWEKITLGAYANYERMALNSGGSTAENYDPMPIILGDGHENYPAYAFRKNVMTLGVNAFFDLKKPFGFYMEYSPESLMYNDGWSKFSWGAIILY